MSPSQQFSINQEIRNEFVTWDKFRWMSLSLSAMFLIVAPSSELWLTNDDSLFTRIKLSPLAFGFLIALISLLICLYSVELYRRTNERSFKRSLAFSLPCTFIDVLIMGILTFIIYWAIGEITSDTYCEAWKLLYISVLLALGEFSLSSTMSDRLRKAKKLEKQVDQVVENLKHFFEEWKAKSAQNFVLPEVDEEFWSKHLKSRSKKEDGSKTES
ncbi:MAG: hypothetical protein ACFFGZ_13660 [Candidatus Thorarchaeota archaeon]